MRPKPPRPTTERTASFGWPSKVAESEQGRWMNTYQDPYSTVNTELRIIQPPWVFMANLDITDGESMRRVAQYFYYKLHHDSQEDLITMLGLDETEAREVQRMYVESQESELLQDMLDWFGAFHDHHERRLVINAQTLSRAVTIHVREPRQYTVGYAHAKVLWANVLRDLEPCAEKKKKKATASRQPQKNEPSVARSAASKNNGDSKAATCRIVMEESDEEEVTTYFDGEIYQEPEEYDELDQEYDVHLEEDEESDEESNSGTGAIDSDAMDVDPPPFQSSPPPINTKKRRFEVVEISSSPSEESVIPPLSLPLRARRRGKSFNLQPARAASAKTTPKLAPKTISAKSTPNLAPKALSAKGKEREKTSMPPPPPKVQKRVYRKRNTSDTSSTSSDLPYRNVFEEDVIIKPLRMTRTGREF